jgi:two-component system chemotaxis response regulator CheY
MDPQLSTLSNDTKSGIAARILIADDDTSSRELLRAILESSGYEVVEAADGVEAMERAADFPPDLVILDIQMPKMDGLAAAQALRKIPSFEKTPIIALTASTKGVLSEDISMAGFTSYLVKPIGPAQLRQHISDLL